MPSQDFLRHAALLGGSGSGKTTLAMSILEQLLGQGVPVLMIDRKGDLARWADPDAWREKAGDGRDAERSALLERIAPRLYTPGDPQGRDLALPVLPAWSPHAQPHDREEAARSSCDALASIIGLKEKVELVGRAVQQQLLLARRPLQPREVLGGPRPLRNTHSAPFRRTRRHPGPAASRTANGGSQEARGRDSPPRPGDSPASTGPHVDSPPRLHGIS